MSSSLPLRFTPPEACRGFSVRVSYVAVPTPALVTVRTQPKASGDFQSVSPLLRGGDTPAPRPPGDA